MGLRRGARAKHGIEGALSPVYAAQMANARVFALICWTLWAALLAAWAFDLMPGSLAGIMAALLYILWRLYRRGTATHA